MTLSEFIREEALKRNTSLAALERNANLGNGTIRRWDSHMPSVDKLAQIANLLNLSLDYLYSMGQCVNELDDKLITSFHRLTQEEQEEILDIIDLKLKRSQAKTINQNQRE